MRRLAFDTSVLSHLVKRTAAPGQERQHADAHRLVREIERNAELAIPTPALAELLVSVPEPQVAEIRRQLEAGFAMLAFDLEAAVRTATLLRGRTFASGTKVKAKFDAQIAATALRWSAALVTTNDRQRALITGLGGEAGPPVSFLHDGGQEPLL